MELLVNNSWSGSCILHTRSNTVGAYVDRCVQLHDDTVDNGTLTITSNELVEGTLLYLAAYDEFDRFSSMQKIVWSGTEQTLTLPAGEKW